MWGMLVVVSCGSSRTAFDPNKKIAPEVLQGDYQLFRSILEQNHPGMYWYTPKDSMDAYFDQGYRRISDSLTESAFRRELAYVISRINCGHTITRASKQAVKYQQKHRIAGFPFSLKFLDSAAVVSDQLQRKDSLITRGALVKSIDGRPIHLIRDSLSRFLSNDGYNTGHSWQLLNSRTTFTSYYQLVFGLDSTVQIELVDTLGRVQKVQRRVKYPTVATSLKTTTSKDSTRKAPRIQEADTTRTIKPSPPKASPTSFRYKGLMMDTTESVAYLVLNTFSNGEGVGNFIRKSFRQIERYGIQYLVIDIRNNGGGNVSNSNLLLKYVKQTPFRLADSLYAVNKTFRYGRYIQYSFWQWPLMTLITHRDAEGRRHFGYYERHAYQPKRAHAYRGNIYLITGYQSFSASSIVAHQLRGQSNVTLVGEPTGGAEYGNNAWLTPMVTLPNTGVRFSLPRFRLVMDKTLEKTGQGVPVDIVAKPTVMSIRKNIDIKMATAGKLIQQKSIQ